MKICIVSTIFPPEIGGPSKHVYQLAKQLSILNHEVHVVTYTNQESRQEMLDGFHVHRISIKNLPKSMLPARIYKMRKYIINICKQYEIGLIYALNIDLAGIPAAMAAKNMKKPVVLRYGGDYIWEIMFKFNKTSRTLHEFYQKESSSLFRSLKRFQSYMLHKFNHIIVPSEYYKNILVSNFNINQEKITVIKNPVDIEVRPRKKKNERYTIVTASRLLRLKGIEYLLESVKIASRRHNDILLQVIGDGPYKQQLIERARELQIENNVVLLPGMEHKDLLSHIANADAYVLSSISEVAPNVILEAMSLKTPVISTLVSDFNFEMNNQVALITQPKDSHTMADAILKLIENKELGKKLADNAFKFVKQHPTWQDALQQTLEIFEKSIQKPSTGQPGLSS